MNPSIVQNILKNFGSSGQIEYKEKTKFDLFMDAFNRVPRPLMLFMIFAMLGWAMISPTQYIAWTGALATTPEWLQYLIFIVVTSFTVKKVIHDLRYKSNTGKTELKATPMRASGEDAMAEWKERNATEQHKNPAV